MTDIDQVLERIPFPAWCHDFASKRVIGVNESAVRRFGRPREALLELGFDDLVPPQDLAAVQWLRERIAARGDQPAALLHRSALKQPSGAVDDVEVIALPARLERGIGMLCVVLRCADVVATPFTDPDTELLEMRERFRMLADHMRDVFWIRAAAPVRFYYVSPAYETMWGLPVEALYADPWAWRRQVLPEYQARLEAVMVGPVPAGGGWELEYPIRRADGAIRWIRTRGFAATGRTGEDLVMGLCEDVTERRVGEAEQRATLIREVHHRIKNNLQGVVGLLSMHAAKAPGAAPYLREAIGQVGAIATVHGLHAQPGTGYLHLCEVVEAIGRSVQELHGTEVRVSVPPERQIILSESEAVAVALIVHELLTNAVKHRDRGAATRVSAVLGRGEDGVTLRVRNRGRIPEGFDLDSGLRNGTGLALLRSLLPPHGASLRLSQQGDDVEARLDLGAPVVAHLGAAPAPSTV